MWLLLIVKEEVMCILFGNIIGTWCFQVLQNRELPKSTQKVLKIKEY